MHRKFYPWRFAAMINLAVGVSLGLASHEYARGAFFIALAVYLQNIEPNRPQ